MSIDNISFSNLELSTITVEGLLSNIQFNLKDTIEYILYNVIDPIKSIIEIDTKYTDTFNKITKNELYNFMNTLLYEKFVLYKFIIKNLYKQDIDKYTTIVNTIEDYDNYNKKILNTFKENCQKIYSLLDTLITINNQIDNIEDNLYHEYTELNDDAKNKLKFIIDEYYKLYNFIYNDNVIITYVNMNKIIKFNYKDIYYIYSNIYSNIEINKILENILILENSIEKNTTLSEYIFNYKSLISDIIKIKDINDDYIINQEQYTNTIKNEYNNINDLSINLDKLKIDFNMELENIKNDWDFINNFIIKIGCNYGEYISDKYVELTKKPIKSKRGRKPKIKTKSNRRKQGTGKYFTSQMTLTIVSDGINDIANKLYHIKIFVNGVIQIPSVTNENINIVIPYLQKIIGYFNKNIEFIKVNKEEEINIEFIKSIMRNYKFYIYNNTDFIYNIKLNELKNILLENKSIINSEDCDEYDIFPLTEIKYNSERYPGCTIKFDISKYVEVKNNKKNKLKQTTVKVFSSGKINIDGANSLDGATKIQNFLLQFINNHRNDLLYKLEDD